METNGNKPALPMRGFMISLHQMNEKLPLAGPGPDGVRLILDVMAQAKLNTLLFEYEAYFVQGATLLRNKKFTVDWELSDSAGKKVLSGKDIPFKVKDISPGKYKLKAMLTRNDGLCVKSTVFPVEILSKMK